jgi:hypothetical protein
MFIGILFSVTNGTTIRHETATTITNDNDTTTTTTSSSSSVYNVPSFTRSELQDLLVDDNSVEYEYDDEDSISNNRKKLQNALSSTGLIAIQVDDREENDTNDVAFPYEQARHIGLSGLCSCATVPASSSSSSSSQHSPSKDMDDNITNELFRTIRGMDSSSTTGSTSMLSSSSNSIRTTRTTFATATIGDIPLNLPLQELTDTCGFHVVHAMETLRDVIADISQTFIHVLDDSIIRRSTSDSNMKKYRSNRHNPSGNSPPVMKSRTGEIYPTIQSIIQSSTHLEHFHVYRNHPPLQPGNDNDEHVGSTTSSSTFNQSHALLNVHTDAGLFLSFVPGLRCNMNDDGDDETTSSSSDLWVQIDHGELSRAIFPPNSVGILLGIGAQNWLHLQQQQQHQNQHQNQQKPWKATKHAVHMPPGASRAWYGKSTYTIDNNTNECEHMNNLWAVFCLIPLLICLFCVFSYLFFVFL